MPDIWLFDCSIDIVLTFKFGGHIVILKMAISDYVDYIKVEQALLIAAQILLNQWILRAGQRVKYPLYQVVESWKQ